MNIPNRNAAITAIVNQALLAAQAGKGPIVTLITRPMYRLWLSARPESPDVAGTETLVIEEAQELLMCVTLPKSSLPSDFA